MKKLHDEGLATHTGPESCADACEGGSEALTGECAGRVFSRERFLLRGADAVRRRGRPHPVHRNRKVYWDPTRSEAPSTHGNTSRGNREIPCPPEANGATGRIGKSKDVRR